MPHQTGEALMKAIMFTPTWHSTCHTERVYGMTIVTSIHTSTTLVTAQAKWYRPEKKGWFGTLKFNQLHKKATLKSRQYKELQRERLPLTVKHDKKEERERKREGKQKEKRGWWSEGERNGEKEGGLLARDQPG